MITGAYIAVDNGDGSTSIYASSPDYAGLPSGAVVSGAIAYAVVGVLLAAEIAWRKFVMLPRAARLGAK